MDSPPRLSALPQMPPTPTKPLRARQRTLNRPTKTHVNCRRCLFGRPNRGEVTQWLDQEMQILNAEQRSRWNFDFATMTPLAGGDWEWEKLSRPAAPPAFRNNPSSFEPLSPLAAQSATFKLPDVPPVGATRPPSISEDGLAHGEEDGLGDRLGENDEFEADVFEGTNEAEPLAKRTRLNADSNDENANPAYSSVVPRPSPFRPVSPLFGRGSLGRSASESADAAGLPSLSTPPSTPTSTTFPSPIGASSSSARNSTFSPTLSATSSAHPLFKEPMTPAHSANEEAVFTFSPPALLSRQRPSKSGTSSSGAASQTRLQQYFSVKRRGLEAGSGGADRSSRKRINFDV